MAGSRRDEALKLSEKILTDIELGRLPSVDVARKTSRLARLLDDAEALEWLNYEIAGYPPSGLDDRATAAARRSNRLAEVTDEGGERFWAGSLAGFDGDIEAARASLSAQAGAIAGEWSLGVEVNRQKERAELRSVLSGRTALVNAIVGSFYDYVASRHQELRFGAAIETSFEVVRQEVDAAISELVPQALPKLSAALENTTSDNPEDWASAAATCRRLLKAAADALRPPGADKNERKMGEEQYINRLVDWIEGQATSDTLAGMIASDLEYLGRRLDAALGAGAKGAHAEVDRFDASRFVTGTYLLLGDVLRLRSPDQQH